MNTISSTSKINLTVFAGLLREAEGVQRRPYLDTKSQVTIGVGHNLSARGLSDEAIAFILAEDMQITITTCEAFPFWSDLNEARQTALAELCFNLGFSALRTFTTFLRFLQNGQYETAATDLRQTLWATQVGASRRDRLVLMIASGAFPQEALSGT